MKREYGIHESGVLSEEQAEDVIGAGYFSNDELDVFYQLIAQRRTLPVYAKGMWYCYECDFQSTDLRIMSMHILGSHSQAPVNDRADEKLEDEWFRPAGRL